MLLCYITDRSQFIGSDCVRRERLLEKIGEAAHAGVDYIQLREKDLSGRELVALARAALARIRQNSGGQNGSLKAGSRKPPTRLLINSRTDVALAAGADGVHLPSDDLSPAQARAIWKGSSGPSERAASPIITVACHSVEDVARAAEESADLAIFAPVFEKKGGRPTGLNALRAACRQRIPVIALGGVSLENAASCEEAGAAGVAGIRLFQGHDIGLVASRLIRQSGF